MKIGIVGSGNMGRTLGLLWAAQGHSVFFGARSKSSIEYINGTTGVPVASGSLLEAVSFGEVLLYNLRDTLPTAVVPKDVWKGKIIIDPNNGEVPSDFNYPPVLESYSEKYQRDLPESFVVKAFNTLSQELYYLPLAVIRKHHVAGFISGDDFAAKNKVSILVKDSGLVPVDCGTLQQSGKLLESFADFVRLLMINSQMGATLGFSATTLPSPTTAPFGVRQPTKYK